MESLAHLKSSLEFNRNLDDIINTTRIATVVQLRQFQAKRWGEEKFLEELRRSFLIFEEKIIKRHPFVFKKETSPKAVLVITSDEGFLGELNTLLMDAAVAEKRDKTDQIIVVGKRGAQYLEELNISYLSIPEFGGAKEIGEFDRLKRYLISEYAKGAFNQVRVVYAEFESVTAQHVRVQTLLPFPRRELEKLLGGTEEYKHLLVEPSLDQVIEGMINLVLSSFMRKIFFSSKLSEFSARLMHLERSYQELTRINRQLRLEYFKSVHALADKRIREILSSRILRQKVKGA